MISVSGVHTGAGSALQAQPEELVQRTMLRPPFISDARSAASVSQFLCILFFVASW